MATQTISGWLLLMFAGVAFASAGAGAQPAKLVNPYTGNADAMAQGEHLFVTKTSSGCHGAGGGVASGHWSSTIPGFTAVMTRPRSS